MTVFTLILYTQILTVTIAEGQNFQPFVNTSITGIRWKKFFAVCGLMTPGRRNSIWQNPCSCVHF